MFQAGSNLKPHHKVLPAAEGLNRCRQFSKRKIIGSSKTLGLCLCERSTYGSGTYQLFQ